MNHQHQSTWIPGLQLQLDPAAPQARVARMPEGSHKRYPPTPYPRARHISEPSPPQAHPQPAVRPVLAHQTHIWPGAPAQMPTRQAALAPVPETSVARVRRSTMSSPRTPTYESAPAPPPTIVRLRPGKPPVVINDEPRSQRPIIFQVYPPSKPLEDRTSYRCVVCHGSYDDRQDLHRHYEKRHPDYCEARVREEDRRARERHEQGMEHSRRASGPTRIGRRWS